MNIVEVENSIVFSPDFAVLLHHGLYAKRNFKNILDDEFMNVKDLKTDELFIDLPPIIIVDGARLFILYSQLESS